MYQLQDDGKIKAPSGNVLDLGKATTDPVAINATNVAMTGTVTIGSILIGSSALALAVPAGTSAATNTTLSVAGTAGSSTGALIMRDTFVNGSLGTTLYCFNDLVRALKVANVIAQ